MKKCIHESAESDVTQSTSSSSASDFSEQPAASMYLSDDDDDEDDDSVGNGTSKADDHTAASPLLYGTHLADDLLGSTPLSNNNHIVEFIALPPAHPSKTFQPPPDSCQDDHNWKSSHMHQIPESEPDTMKSSPLPAVPSHHHRSRSEIPKLTLNESYSFSSDEDDYEDGITRTNTPDTKKLPRHRRTGSDVTVRMTQGRNGAAALYASEGINPVKPGFDSTTTTIDAGQSTSKTLSHLHATLQMHLHRFGANHPQVAEAWNRLGNYYFRSRSYSQALDCYREAARCCTGTASTSSNEPQNKDENAVASLDHLATAYRNIGAVYWATGKTNLAIPNLHKALDVYQGHKAFASISSKQVRLAMASTWYQLGLALTLQQSYDQASEALWHAKSIREQFLSAAHTEVGRTVDAIGKVFYYQGNYDAAMKCHQDALQIKQGSNKKASSSSTTNGVMTSLMNIAVVHQARGEYSRAIRLYKQVLHTQMASLAQGRLTCSHKSWSLVRAAMEVGETFQLLSDLYRVQGNVNQAQRMCKEAILVYREAGLDEHHPQMQLAFQQHQQQHSPQS